VPAHGFGQKRQGGVPEIGALFGVGLHSGAPCAVRLRPGPPGGGWRLNGGRVPECPLTGTFLATTLATPSGPVETTEHLFAALAGLGVADVDLEVEGGEVPILDGSARPFCDTIRAAGLARPGLPLRALPDRALQGLEALRGVIELEPAASFRIEVEARPPVPGAGHFAFTLDTFEAQVAPARTFGRFEDAERLRGQGRALGASLENCVVFSGDGVVLNAEGLRFPDEPLRHKALDLLGDLGRLGWLPAAVVRARGAGHAAHAALVRALAGD
jgi:UDP-3-O-[3-hydroxymyristoyl] N-acetylglucosamine deacetylase